MDETRKTVVLHLQHTTFDGYVWADNWTARIDYKILESHTDEQGRKVIDKAEVIGVSIHPPPKPRPAKVATDPDKPLD